MKELLFTNVLATFYKNIHITKIKCYFTKCNYLTINT
jgi:hypothetical protein